MRKNRLSLLTSIAVSLSIMLGILVADLVNVPTLTSARAQRGARLPVAAGTVVGDRIAATQVLVNGVATNGVFLSRVVVVDSVLAGGDTTTNGIYPSDGVSGYTVNGIYPSDGVSGYTVNGIYPSDGVAPSTVSRLDGIYPSDGLMSQGPELFGGTVEGKDVRVVDGVITGRNLRVVGTVIRGAVLNNGGAAVSE